MPVRNFSSFAVFHRFVPSLVQRISKDASLATRAMANPMLALEEVGVKLTPEVAWEVERRVRFTADRRRRIEDLEQRLVAVLGARIDPESPLDLEQILFHQLKLRRPDEPVSLELPRKGLPPWLARGGHHIGKQTARVGRPASDPLERWRGQHPVVELLLDYRTICAAAPRFVSRAEYEALKAKPDTLPIARVTLRLPEHTEEPHA